MRKQRSQNLENLVNQKANIERKIYLLQIQLIGIEKSISKLMEGKQLPNNEEALDDSRVSKFGDI